MYEYECEDHGLFRSYTRADRLQCIHTPCTNVAQRRWGVNVGVSFQPHFNPSLGLAVNSQSQFESELSRASEAASQPAIVYDANGGEHHVERPVHNFQPVDMHDKQALGVTNDGLDATYDRWKSLGRDDDAKKLKKLMDD